VTAFDWVAVLEVMPLVHPVTANTATVSKGAASRKSLSCDGGNIFGLFSFKARP
jgi:hypothetical protein